VLALLFFGLKYQWIQLDLTALKSNKYSGWATITHPFHPLKGQRFEVLSSRTINKRDILSLKTPEQPISVMAIPLDWTDRADPTPYLSASDSLPLLSLTHLEQLADLINKIMHSAPHKVIDKQ
jgi:hypothetical protein